MQCKFTVVIYNCMTCVRSSLKSYDDVCFFSQHIGNLTFTFIAPVCSYNSLYHMCLLL